MIPPPPPPPGPLALMAAARGHHHADPAPLAIIPVSRPPGGMAISPGQTSPGLPKLGGGGRLAQIAAGQPISCNCGQVFPNLDILERHMAKAHPDNTNLVSQSVSRLLGKVFLFSLRRQFPVLILGVIKR